MIRATFAHARVLATIHADAFPDGERWGWDAISLQLEHPGGLGFIVEGAGGPVGFVLVRVVADEAEILTLAVLSTHRQHGYGRALLLAALAETGRLGAVAMFLEVSEENTPAIALYSLLGFVDVGRREGYYPGGRAARVLRRELPFSDGATSAM